MSIRRRQVLLLSAVGLAAGLGWWRWGWVGALVGVAVIVPLVSIAVHPWDLDDA